jgi:hypothetical protein
MTMLHAASRAAAVVGDNDILCVVLSVWTECRCWWARAMEWSSPRRLALTYTMRNDGNAYITHPFRLTMIVRNDTTTFDSW